MHELCPELHNASMLVVIDLQQRFSIGYSLTKLRFELKKTSTHPPEHPDQYVNTFSALFAGSERALKCLQPYYIDRDHSIEARSGIEARTQKRGGL